MLLDESTSRNERPQPVEAAPFLRVQGRIEVFLVLTGVQEVYMFARLRSSHYLSLDYPYGVRRDAADRWP
jgi:hypothetical protein